jgi:ornithine carbamoyltransferase
MIGRHFLSIRDLSTDELRDILVSAFAIKSEPAKYRESLKGKALAMIFEKPSLRTRVTFDVGIHQMGGFSVYLSPAEINLGKREPVRDVARNLERMVQGIMIRTFSHGIVEEMARFSSGTTWPTRSCMERHSWESTSRWPLRPAMNPMDV